MEYKNWRKRKLESDPKFKKEFEKFDLIFELKELVKDIKIWIILKFRK